MGRGSERDDAETNDEPSGQESDAAGGDLSARRTAAAYLRAAKLTDDARERETLRQKAAELLSPRRSTSSAAGPRASRKP